MDARIWQDADVELAVRMWIEGSPGSEISKALDGRYTRSSVVGKMNRLGHARDPMARRKKSVKPKPVSIDDLIRKRHENGQRPTEISNALKMATSDVVMRLEGMGLDPRQNVPTHYQVHPMWSLPENERRIAFYEKFSAGWAEVQARLEADAKERAHAGTKHG